MNNLTVNFIQSRDIKEFSPIIRPLLPDFGAAFCQTILEWCKLMDDAYDNFWEVWLVKDKNKTIGICGLYSLNGENTDELWLGWLGLVPEYRNKNIGKTIMQHLYKQANDVGCKKIFSYVDKEGKPLSFYKREGFEIIGTVGQYLYDNKLSKIDGDEFESMDDFVIMKEI